MGALQAKENIWYVGVQDQFYYSPIWDLFVSCFADKFFSNNTECHTNTTYCPHINSY